MEYPKWLKEMDDCSYVYCANQLPEVARIIEMAKDAWAMAYLRGTGQGMRIEDFLDKYQDAPKNEIPYVAFDHPNDGAGI